MQLAEIYDPLVFGFSDKKHYKDPGTEFLRTAHASVDAMELDTILQEKIPILTPELKEQLIQEGRCCFCPKVSHITQT